MCHPGVNGQNMRTGFISQGSQLRPARRGWSLLELTVVLAVMGILLAVSAPSVHRALEQARADTAAVKLRAVWSAQRLYWLEYRTYAADLAQLESLGLLDRSTVSDAGFYAYAITAADATSFQASATRTGSMRWGGGFTIDQEGLLTGVIQASGESDIVPGFQ